MRCPRCKNIVNDGNLICDRCGAKLKNRGNMNAVYILFIVIFSAIIVGIVIWYIVEGNKSSLADESSYSAGNESAISTTAGYDPSKVVITLKEFNQIENGMTYEEVRDIIGGDGILVSEVGEKNSVNHCVLYKWEGKDSWTNAQFTFEDGKLYCKSQYGLE